jgi:hypothetical protein
MKGGKMSKLIFACERKLLLITLVACFLSIFVAANASAAGKILFTSDRDGNNDIYVMNADGSGVTQLTNGPGDNWTLLGLLADQRSCLPVTVTATWKFT